MLFFSQEHCINYKIKSYQQAVIIHSALIIYIVANDNTQLLQYDWEGVIAEVQLSDGQQAVLAYTQSVATSEVPVRRGDFDRFWQFLANYSRCRNAIFLNTCSIEQLTILAHHVKILRSLLGWKYFILFFKDRTSLTSAAGVTLIGQYKHTNINLTTEMGSDWLICHVSWLNTAVEPRIAVGSTAVRIIRYVRRLLCA